jgi:hypothetical protein
VDARIGERLQQAAADLHALDAALRLARTLARRACHACALPEKSKW